MKGQATTISIDSLNWLGKQYLNQFQLDSTKIVGSALKLGLKVKYTKGLADNSYLKAFFTRKMELDTLLDDKISPIEYLSRQLLKQLR